MMAGQGQIESAAHAVARDRCVHRSREVIDHFHQRLPHLGELKRITPIELRNFLQVRARGKEAIVPGNYQRPSNRCRLAETSGQRLHALARKPVHHIFRSQPQNPYFQLLLDMKSRKVHRNDNFKRSRQCEKLKPKAEVILSAPPTPPAGSRLPPAETFLRQSIRRGYGATRDRERRA